MAIAPTEFPIPEAALADAVPHAAANPALDFRRRLLRNPLARIGLTLIALLILVFLFAPQISSIDPQKSLPNGLNEMGTPHRPGDGFLLGADTLGRDVWTRTLYGTRVSLVVAFCAMLTATLIGTTVGLISGFFGGIVDAILMRITEVVLSLPTVLLAIALAYVLPGESASQRFFKLLLAITLVTWTGIARTVRGEVLSLKEREFVEAARAVGSPPMRIVTTHLLPNVMPTVIMLATLATANNILLEAGLSFLGVGIDPGTPSWGGMIAEGQPYILSAPWIIIAPGAAVVAAVAAFNLVGQAMQETLDPRR